MVAAMAQPEIRAAGGVIVGEDGRIAVVHRPRHGDWSLPKGKLEPGESWEEAALREMAEECGLVCRLEDELPSTEYAIGARRKRVRWWRMSVVGETGRPTDDEVDELRWLTPGEAIVRLDYEADRALVRAL
jgi:8-oxo-dGTP diphosphatase